MSILFLAGVLLGISVSSTPDFKLRTAQTSLSYYSWNSSHSIKDSDTGEVVGSFKPVGSFGFGGSLIAHHKSWPEWNYTLTLHTYPEFEYATTFYSAGVQYEVQRPRTAMFFALGFEVGEGDLIVSEFEDFGKVPSTLGWETYAKVTNHFVFFGKVWNYFFQPSFRSYPFVFDGKDAISDEVIDSHGLVLTSGLGYQF